MSTINPYVHDSGHLDVGHHKIYWEDWGSRTATPIFYLHGGPGNGFYDRNKLLFNPEKHRVIFHDQRGSGESIPFAETTENTTQDLIADIERLRSHLKLGKIYVTGGSWGSALSLLYTIAHPESVERFVIWSVFTARQFDVDFVNEGYPRYFFPEAWERFISFVPEQHRVTGDSVMTYYAGKIRSDDKIEARKYADEWTLWEYTLCSINYDPDSLEKEIFEDKDTLAIARLETHYFLNKCFVPENYIFDNLNKIKHILCTVVGGRFDMCTPPISSADLKESYGENLTLKWTNSGHMSTDPEMFATLKDTFETFFRR